MVDLSYQLWHKTAVPIFVERFLLPLFAAAVVVLALTNPMGFDWIQRVTGSLALILLAYFVAHSIYKNPLAKPAGPTSNPTPTEKPPTLSDLFTRDFPTVLKATDEAEIDYGDKPIGKVKRQLYLDFDAKTKFVGFYVPNVRGSRASDTTAEICMALSNLVQNTIVDMEKKVELSGGTRDQMESSRQLTFSGRVMIYHDDFLSITQKAKIIDAFVAHHCDVQFRGPAYLGDQTIAWYHEHNKKAQAH